MDKSAPSQVVKSLQSKLSTRDISIVSSSYWQRLACTKWWRGEMTSPRQSWSVLVAKQRNNQVLRQADVMLDGRRRRHGRQTSFSLVSPLSMERDYAMLNRKWKHIWTVHNGWVNVWSKGLRRGVVAFRIIWTLILASGDIAHCCLP